MGQNGGETGKDFVTVIPIFFSVSRLHHHILRPSLEKLWAWLESDIFRYASLGDPLLAPNVAAVKRSRFTRVFANLCLIFYGHNRSIGAKMYIAAVSAVAHVA